MEVYLAAHSGFCFGVEKAIQRARQELASQDPSVHPVYSLGPVIHNRQVVQSLEEKGLTTIQRVKEAKSGTVIIRSHGVPEKIYREIEAESLRLVDTTCPFVKKIQTIVQEHHRLGHTIVIIGNGTHPEVVGINGWCGNQGIVINSVDDLDQIPVQGVLCVVAQTTMPVSLFESVRETLSRRDQEIHWYNTICHATQERQEAARELAQQVDAMVVIGGSHSSNTRKLAEVCRQYLPEHTYLVEDLSDLPLGKLTRMKRVGVTAGASTPDPVIQEIIEVLRKIEPDQRWQIAIDGPAGAGKSTIARKLAEKLHFTYIDTGAMYRAYTIHLLQTGVDFSDENRILEEADHVHIHLEKEQVFLNGDDVTGRIRSEEVTKGVSAIASIRGVRLRMVELQRRIAETGDVVMDGRDIGTVVLPQAQLKVFLTASVEERARRRYEELKDQPGVTFEKIFRQIRERDYVDEHREHDPLIPADDAVQIDSTSLSVNEVVEKITRLFCERIKREND